MKYLSAEYIKLFSTRSIYWCLAIAVLVAGLFAMMMGLISIDGEQFASTGMSQTGMGTAMMVFVVAGALAATTEYRFGTIRSTFVAAPQRVRVLAAKTGLVALIGVGLALVAALAAFFITKGFASNPFAPLDLKTAGQLRSVFGQTAIFAIAGVLAVAVGTLIRQSAGAIALLLVWAALLEDLVSLIPRVGSDISKWMPFKAGAAFTTNMAEFDDAAGTSDFFADALGAGGPTPIQGLLVFAGTALALWLLAAFVLVKRDA